MARKTGLVLAGILTLLAAPRADAAVAASPAVAGSVVPQSLSGQELRPLSLASSDFDRDGIRDLAAGFGTLEGGVVILYRGNADALYPHSPEARQRRATGESAREPFLPTDRVLILSVPPDFLFAGDFDADGNADLAAIARGGASVELHRGDGGGGFHESETLALSGPVTAAAVGDLGQRDGLPDLVAATDEPAGPRAIVYRGPAGALRAPAASLALQEPADSISIESAGATVALEGPSGAYRLEFVDRAWSLVRSGDVSPRREAALRPADVASTLPLRVGPNAGGGVVLGSDGGLRVVAEATAATFVVVVATDLADTAPGNGICADVNGQCSLRAAIQEANASAGVDAITFAIPGSGVPTISTPGLPALTEAVTVDGTTQPAGRVAITGTSNGTLLTLSGGSSVVRGLVLNGSGNFGLRIQSPDNVIEGNFFGTTADGTATQGSIAGPNILVSSGANNRIGGTTALARNVVASGSLGLRLDGGTTILEGNFIGTDVTGTLDLGSAGAGIRAFLAANNTIGGAAAGAGNLVSGNQGEGILLDAGGNLVQGNRVGTNATGTLALGNGSFGIHVGFSADNTIGGTAPGAGNLISGNGNTGLQLDAAGITPVVNTLVQGNRIGTNALATAAVPNLGRGIAIVAGTGVVIGGTSASARNIISGNLQDGIFLTKFSTVNNVDAVIQGNFIGTDVTGTAAVPNLQNGVSFEYSENALVGGTEPGAANVISGNIQHGIDVSLIAITVPPTIQGNRIGTNAFGTGPLGNGESGIHFPSNSGATIGGTAAGQANVVAFNAAAGIGSSALRSLHTGPNAVHSNGGLGHDIGTDGPTPNRPGATNNFPVLTLAEDIGGGTSVAGTLDAKAATNFQVHLYSSPTCDASGYGEGREYRKTVNFTTDASGHGVFATTITPAIPGGRYVTAFAVGPNADASEFSFCRRLVGGPPPADLPLEVSAATPPRGGNTGSVTLRITGQGFVPPATARLERAGSPDRVASAVVVSPDGYTLTATFDLAGAAIGAWDVTVGIPGGSATLQAAFTVEAGTEPKIWADLLGRGTLVVRGGREQTFFVVFGNRGNTDSPPVLLRVSIPWQLRVTVVEPAGGSARVVSVDSPITTGGSGRSTIWITAPSVPAASSTPVMFRVLTLAALPGEFGEAIDLGIDWTSAASLDSLFQTPSDPTVGATADVTANTPSHVEATIHLSNGIASGDLHFDLAIADVPYESDGVHRTISGGGLVEHDYTIAFSAGPDEAPKLYTAVLQGPEVAFALARDGATVSEARRKETQEGEEIALLQSDALLDAARAAALNDVNGLATAFDAVVAALSAALPPGLIAAPTDGGFISVEELQTRLNADVQRKLYAAYLADPSAWNSQLYQTVDLADQGHARSKDELISTIVDKWDGDGADRGTVHSIVEVFTAIDPNEKKGASGTGDASWITGDTPIPYTITFENLEGATGAAQEVVVTDTLDGSKLDLARFELGPIAFGTRVVDVPPGLTSFTGDVDLRPEIQLVARVTADFNPATGVAVWHFFSLDPSTGQPTSNPILGFLPPNVATPEGEGHVSFFIRAKSGLASGTQIHNQASIVFDANAPIVTGDWRNTIDVTAPTSAVDPLPAPACAAIAVSWSGADAHSGIASYDVLVSENGGPFTRWLTRTTATSAPFYGDVGSTYAFFSVARDSAGNVEAAGTADASTTLGNPSPLIDALLPTSGPASGATVAIAGSAFEDGASVAVGGVSAVGATTVDPTSLTATFPALTPGGLYDVVVTNPTGCGDSLFHGWFADYSDVDATHPFHDFVEKVVRRGVTAGCSGGNYCPGNPVTRAQMAVFLIKARYSLSLVPPAATGTLFLDVAPGSFAADWIEQLANEGVTGGCGGGNYCPASSVSRKQMAVFLLKARNGALYAPPPATGVFLDVPPGDPFAPWIEQLAAEQITGGCGAGNYCPNNPVTRGQMAVFLSKAFGF